LDLLPETGLHSFTGRSRRAEEKQHFIDSSIYQEFPCYGYQFPIKNHTKLSWNDRLYTVSYYIRIDNRKCVFTIKPLRSSKREKSIIIMNDVFDILRKDTDEKLNGIEK
jgi:hypothetical protein